MTPDFQSDRAEQHQKGDQAESRVFIDMADPKNSLTAKSLSGPGHMEGSGKGEPAFLNFDDPFKSGSDKNHHQGFNNQHDGYQPKQANQHENNSASSDNTRWSFVGQQTSREPFDLERFVSSFNLSERARWMFQAIGLNYDPSNSYAAAAYDDYKANQRVDSNTKRENFAPEVAPSARHISKNHPRRAN